MRTSKETLAAVKRWLATIGRKGGQSTSPAKVAAAIENGMKGGRPRKDGKPVKISRSRNAPGAFGKVKQPLPERRKGMR